MMEALSVEAALEVILAHVEPLPARSVALDEALGRILAESMDAAGNLPPFSNAAVDGFAVRVADVASACRTAPVRLQVLAEVPAGTVTLQEVRSGGAVRIMTGALLPPGTEAVVPVEDTVSTPGEVQVFRGVAAGQNIRRAGEDVRAGDRVIDAGTELRPSEIGLLAALGQMDVRVHPAPRIAILTTGAELVDARETPGPGQIRDANLHGLAAQVRVAGAEPRLFPRVADDRESLAQALRCAVETCDGVITNGGVSAGDFDFVKEVLGRLGAVRHVSQVAQKPGRPLNAWTLRGRPVFGLPGNPVAAMVCFEMFARPALRRMAGKTKLFRPKVLGRLLEDYRCDPGDPRTLWLRVQARETPEGWGVASTGAQGSGILSSMTRSNALAEIPGFHGPLKAGDRITVHLTDQSEDH